MLPQSVSILISSQAIRVPDLPLLLKLSSLAGPLACSSANISSFPTSRTAQEAALAANGKVISILADRLTDHIPSEGMLYLSEEGFDLEFSAQRAISRNRCIHAMAFAAIAAQCSLRTGGTWDGSVKNLRFGWSPLYVFADGSESADLLTEMGAIQIGFDDLKDLRNLPSPEQMTI